jgi:hypothetical protein
MEAHGEGARLGVKGGSAAAQHVEHERHKGRGERGVAAQDSNFAKIRAELQQAAVELKAAEEQFPGNSRAISAPFRKGNRPSHSPEMRSMSGATRYCGLNVRRKER